MHLAGLTNLVSLNLDDNPINDAGLAHLKNLTSLQELSLVSARIGDAGLAQPAGPDQSSGAQPLR